MKYFFTSDYHLGHSRIIEYCKRPFKTVEEMNETIIKNHNEKVKPGDVVFFLGDFCFCKGNQGGINKAIEYEKRLNGKIIFIKGNHDHTNTLNAVIENMEITHGGMNIFMTHNPDDADMTFKLNLVGHAHEKWKSQIIENQVKSQLAFDFGYSSVLINIGVDVWNFRPVSIEEILKEYQRTKK